ncbi:MAG: CvpA family protein [Terriglobia bacterium]
MDAWQTLTPLDWVVLIVLAASMVGSFIRGFARELISLGAVAVGIALACWNYQRLASFFAPFVKTEDIASFCAFVLIFVVTLLVGGIVSHLVRNFIRFVDLQWVDRILGLAFGLLRGCLVSSVLFMVLTTFPIQIESVEKARFAPYLLVGARMISVATPASIKTKFMEQYQRIQKLWQEEIKKKTES